MSALTQREKNRILDQIVDDLTLEPSYVFISKYTEWPDEDSPPVTDYSVDGIQEVRDELVVGKKLSASNVRRMIRRVDWESNTVFDYYQSDDKYLADSDFYAVTSGRNVYKCLYNADGDPSTVEPSLTGTTPFTTADGYVWKYMFTIPSDDMDEFATTSYVPFSSNTTIESAAVPGTIDVVRIDTSGNNWTIYESGSVIGVVSNNVFQIANTAESSNGHYVNSSFFVVSGGGSGFLSEIVSYVSNSSGNFLATEESNANVAFGSSYVLAPTIKISGDGTGAEAYAVVNTATAVIENVVVNTPGNGYTWATVTAYSNVGASNSDVAMSAMISPRTGHGADPKVELYSDAVAVKMKFEANDAPLVAFRVAGVVREVEYSNGASYSDSTLVGYSSANVALATGVTSPPEAGETVTGQTSMATATVLVANTTYVQFGDVSGTFAEDETVISSGDSSSIFTVSGIDSPVINADSGTVTFFEHFEAVQRSDSSSENVKLTIKI